MPGSIDRRHFIAQGTAAALWLAAPLSARAAAFPRYRISDLGDLGGSTISVRGINDAGVAVGMATRHDLDKAGVAFICDGGPMRGLRMEKRSVSSAAAAINNAGVVAGYDVDRADAHFTHSAWTWDGSARQYFTKQALTDSTYTTDINDDGVVTGFVYPSAAVLWRDGQLIDLSTETGLSFVQANALNNAGDVVGVALGRKRRFQSCLYRHGAATLLDIFGTPEHEATDINASGQVCGRYTQVVDERRCYGYFWRDGVATELGQLPGPEQAIFPAALNDAGMVVGTSVVTALVSPRVPHAFVWQNGSMVDLNRLIDGDRDGWVLNKAVDINNQNQIVGQATRHGVPRAFIATPV